MQSYNATDRDEYPDEEDQHDANFAFRATGLQRYEIGDREKEHDQIEEDVESRVRVPRNRKFKSAHI